MAATGKPKGGRGYDDEPVACHPTWWHARDYGLFAANPFGIHDFEKGGDKAKGNHLLAHGQTLVLRYRVLIESGGPDQAKLAEMHAAFGKDAN